MSSETWDLCVLLGIANFVLVFIFALYKTVCEEGPTVKRIFGNLRREWLEKLQASRERGRERYQKTLPNWRG